MTAHGEALIERLTPEDANAAALVLRSAFDERLPRLAGLHTPEEDRWFFRETVFPTNEVWGAVRDRALLGFVAFAEGWVNHLYVLPTAQGRGYGSRLLDVAKAGSRSLQLWTFRKNEGARRFYEARGFAAVAFTDGSRNEEGEPDVLYRWARP